MTKWCKHCAMEHPLTAEFWNSVEGRPKCKAYLAAWKAKKQAEDPDYFKGVALKYYYENASKCRERASAWNRAHPEKTRQASAKWYEANPEYAVNYMRTRRLKDPGFRLIQGLRNSLHQRIRHTKKTASAVRDLGCSIGFLKLYLAERFELGMSWDNYGSVWEVDHILPLANYDLSDRGTLRRLVHHTNLQPLFVNENRAKGNREQVA
jgi:hypothetical protein